MINRIFIIDLDHTLVDVNTTFHFLEYITPGRYAILSKLLRPLMVFNRHLKTDLYKKAIVCACLSGMKKDDLNEKSRNYFEIIRESVVNKTLISFLNENPGKKILVSASLDFIVDNFMAFRFNEVVGSKTKFKSGKFASFDDLYCKKHKLIEKYLDEFKKIYVIDDSPESELFNMKHIVILNPKDISRGKYAKIK